jgi:hypothetical protein
MIHYVLGSIETCDLTVSIDVTYSEDVQVVTFWTTQGLVGMNLSQITENFLDICTYIYLYMLTRTCFIWI